jgi:hypothetical protein
MSMTVSEAGKKGGKTTRRKYGKDHYRNIGEVGGAKTRDSHPPEFYSMIGKKGAEARRKLRRKANREKKD